MPYRIFQLCLVVFTVLWISSCKEYEPELIMNRIPEEDRFIYDTGDLLIYSCSDGSLDTVWVRQAEFYTQSSSEKDWFGNTWKQQTDHSKVTLEIADTTWLRLLYYACYEPGDCNACVNIETEIFSEEIPRTMAYFGCGEYGGLIIASYVAAVSELNLNGRIYKNVYSWSHYKSISEGFSMYWSLKYGIIRFEEEAGEHTYSWDLVLAGGES